MEVQNRLMELRAKRGYSAVQLAKAVEVSRQTIYAMEAGSYVPNTVVALKLSQALGVTVEEIFSLKEEKTRSFPLAEVELLPLLSQDGSLQPGQPVHLCRVGNRVMAVPAESGTWGLPSADALVLEAGTRSRRSTTVKVQILSEDYKSEKRLLLGGCDPSAPVLARHLQRRGVNLVVTYQNSSRSLELLKLGALHIAGIHFAEGESETPDLAAIRKVLGKQPLEVVRYASWEEGIVVASGNPKNIQGVNDLKRNDVMLINREPGAGCRLLLDSLFEQAGIDSAAVAGYDKIALGHLPAARCVQEREADCCISTRAAARVLGLGFVPLVSKRYDLVVRRSHAKLPQVEILFETLGHAAFRRELETLWGYDLKASGDRLK